MPPISKLHPPRDLSVEVADTGELPRQISSRKDQAGSVRRIDAVRLASDLAGEAMVTEKLRDAINAFAKDQLGLRQSIASRLFAASA